jgi:hypothetical protein
MSIYSVNPDDDFFHSLKDFVSKIPEEELISDSNLKIRGGWDWTGKKHSEETKKLLSEQRSGENNPFFGKKLPFFKSQLGRPLSEEHKKSISRTKTGVPRSEETKRKISEARKKSINNIDSRPN